MTPICLRARDAHNALSMVGDVRRVGQIVPKTIHRPVLRWITPSCWEESTAETPGSVELAQHGLAQHIEADRTDVQGSAVEGRQVEGRPLLGPGVLAQLQPEPLADLVRGSLPRPAQIALQLEQADVLAHRAVGAQELPRLVPGPRAAARLGRSGEAAVDAN